MLRAEEQKLILFYFLQNAVTDTMKHDDSQAIHRRCPHNYFLFHFAVRRLTDSHEDTKKSPKHTVVNSSEHLYTGSGVDVHHGVSLQEVDFRVDTFHYNLLPNALKGSPRENK